jgi:hypothetical protein
MLGDIDKLFLAGTLTFGEASSWTSMITAALVSLDQGNFAAADNQLDAFVKEINVLVHAHFLSRSRSVVDRLCRVDHPHYLC